jgi:hypothetical protein
LIIADVAEEAESEEEVYEMEWEIISAPIKTPKV